MPEFRVDISRRMVPKVVVNGLEIEQDWPLNYVDCYFPDGTQKTCGNIARDAKAGEQFAPIAGVKQDLINRIQAEINKQLGCTETNAAAPVVVAQYVGNDFESDEEDDD